MAASLFPCFQDAVFDTEINSYNMIFRFFCFIFPAFLTTYDFCHISGNGGFFQDFQTFFQRCIYAGNQCFSAAEISNRSCQFSGINARNPRHIKLFHHFRQCCFCTEIGGMVFIFPHNHSANGRMECFIIIRCHTIVPNQRICHHNPLIGIRRVRKNFLIPNDTCMEHQFKYFVCICTKAITIILAAIFYNQFSVIRSNHICSFLPILHVHKTKSIFFLGKRKSCADKSIKQRMRTVGTALEFGMILDANEKWMAFPFYRFHQISVRRNAAANQSCIFQCFPVLVLIFIAMVSVLVTLWILTDTP